MEGEELSMINNEVKGIGPLHLFNQAREGARG